jgi:hypothetical protein
MRSWSVEGWNEADAAPDGEADLLAQGAVYHVASA